METVDLSITAARCLCACRHSRLALTLARPLLACRCCRTDLFLGLIDVLDQTQPQSTVDDGEDEVRRGRETWEVALLGNDKGPRVEASQGPKGRQGAIDDVEAQSKGSRGADGELREDEEALLARWKDLGDERALIDVAQQGLPTWCRGDQYRGLVCVDEPRPDADLKHAQKGAERVGR